jgi:hypothetical protein
MILRRTFPLLAAGAALAAPLAAQPVTVSTVPMGGMVVEVPAGLSLVSSPFVGPIAFQGPVSVDEGIVSVVGEISESIGSLYAQVLSASNSSLEGRISSIVSTAFDGTTTTILFEESLGIGSGDVIAVRRFLTVSELFANSGVADNDSIVLLNPDGSSDILVYFFGNWYDQSAGFALADDYIIFPGEAVALTTANSSGLSLLLSGSVSVDPVTAFLPGNSLRTYVGSLDPLGNIGIGSIFTSLDSNDSLSLLSDPSQSFIFFAGDWYRADDGSFALSNSVAIPPAQGAVLTTGSSQFFTIPGVSLSY